MAIKRYTKSLIGLMEMDKDGKYCLYEDVEKGIKLSLDLAERYFNMYKEEFVAHMKVYSEIDRWMNKAYIYMFILLFSLTINIVVLVENISR